MCPWRLWTLLMLLPSGCGPRDTPTDTGPVLALRIVENDRKLQVRYASGESLVPLEDGKKFALRNEQLSVTGTMAISERMILDLQLEVETKLPLKVEFTGFPTAAVLRDGKQVPAVSRVPAGKHQFRITSLLAAPAAREDS